MFQPGIGLTRKFCLFLLLYAIFLALGLEYSGRIFHANALMLYGLCLAAAMIVPMLVWFKIRQANDKVFAARAEALKEKKAQQSGGDSKAGVLYVILFHVAFLITLPIFALEVLKLAPEWPRDFRLTTVTAITTAVAGGLTMAVFSLREKSKKLAQQ